MDHYIELTSALKVKKAKKLPSEDLEEDVYQFVKKEVDTLLATEQS